MSLVVSFRVKNFVINKTRLLKLPINSFAMLIFFGPIVGRHKVVETNIIKFTWSFWIVCVYDIIVKMSSLLGSFFPSPVPHGDFLVYDFACVA